MECPMPPAKVSIQAEPFDLAREVARIEAELSGKAGAVVTFSGLCRNEDGRLAALELEHYPGMAEAEIGRVVAEAEERWPLQAVRVIVSNTGDDGWALSLRDGPALLADTAPAPEAFPARLLVLLHDRWQAAPDAELTLLPCELVSRNGAVLGDLVVALARSWHCPPAFIDWLLGHVVWASSLVDRIVAQALEPVGAVAEPYALWAVQAQPRLQLPCRHPALIVTEDLARHERLKLFLLNLGHTMLAELWRVLDRAPDMTVRQAMEDHALRQPLEDTWQEEVVPVLAALGQGEEALVYLDGLRDRLLNPFLEHRLADIAQHHASKKARRLLPVVELARRHVPALAQSRLRAALRTS